jgi:hypothetical protein
MASLILALLAAPSPNLVSNPAFDQGIFDPEGWSLNRSEKNEATWVCDRANPKLCAIRLVGCGRDWAGATSEGFPVKPGETLTVAVWVQATGVADGGGHAYVRFFEGGRFNNQVGPNVQPDCPPWTLCAGTVVAPAQCDRADCSLQLWSQGTVLLGAVGVFRGDVLAGVADLLPKPPKLDPVAVEVPHGLPTDANQNGLADSLETFLEVPAGAQSLRRLRRNTTCLQTPTPYRPDNDLKVDSILVVNPSREAIGSWQRMGYRSYFMAGFRDGPAYVAAHPGSVQQDRSGRLLDCGLGSYYLVPTEDRRRVMGDLFREAFRNGAEGAAPEEPEYIGSGGYSPAFQEEFQRCYGRPWVAPHTSPQARVDCQRLMGHLEVELLRACYDGARSVNPDAQAFLLCHSPLSYSAWGIMFPHYEALSKLAINQMIAQVWTGTARSATRYQGTLKERTFENGYLEYSSCVNLVRGKGLPLWLLMDPLEDNPDRPMEDYFVNYKRTLGAALMFPETDQYEVMPWPTRIFGRVPGPFATVICTVVNALSDMQNQTQVTRDCGTPGIASFLGDSAMWQRQEPAPSDFDAIYALTLPLLMKGLPVELAQLDRVHEPKYLDRYRVLLVSFDALKPQTKGDVDGLTAWVRAGGHLLVFGGEDAYNDLAMWWQDEGCGSPHDYLLRSLGLNPAGRRALTAATLAAPFEPVAKTDYTGRNLENRGRVKVDLTRFIKDTGAAFVKLEDTIKQDGWGPWIGSLRVIGTRDGKLVDVTLKPGTPEETALIAGDTGSGFNGEARFVDAANVLVYRLQFDPGARAELDLDLGNQYCVSAAPAPREAAPRLRPAGGSELARTLAATALPPAAPVFAYPDLHGTPLVVNDAGAVIAEAAAGKGSVLVCGLPAATFAKSAAADRLLRDLVRHVCEQRAKITYREQGHIGIRRGAYEVIKTFDGAAHLGEPTIDLMSADLAVSATRSLGPDEVAILKHLPRPVGPAPVVAASSACLEWQQTQGNELRLIASGAAGVPGVIRLVTGGKGVSVSACDAFGQPREVRVEGEGNTRLLRFDSEPQGLAMRIRAE